MLDGNRLPLTKEEVLKNVRDRRNIAQGDRQSRKAVWRTIQTDTERIEGNGTEGRETPQRIYGGNAINEGDAGSGNGSSNNARQASGTATGSNASIHQHVGGAGRIAETQQRVANIASNVKSIFNPYKSLTDDRRLEKTKKPLKESKRLTEQESIRMRPMLITTILWTSVHADEFIIATTKGHDRSIEIWSNIDRDEAEILADFMIARGKQSAVAAEYVRKAVDFMDRLKLLVIVAPRTYKTLLVYLTKGISIY